MVSILFSIYYRVRECGRGTCIIKCPSGEITQCNHATRFPRSPRVLATINADVSQRARYRDNDNTSDFRQSLVRAARFLIRAPGESAVTVTIMKPRTHLGHGRFTLRRAR